MRLVTFQPLNVALDGQFFCLAVDEHTMERIYITGPSYPQQCIVFDTEEYVEIDSVSRVNSLFQFTDYEMRPNCRYKEYLVEGIDKDSIVYTETITTETDVMSVQSAFQDAQHNYFRALSPYKWKTLDKLPSNMHMEFLQKVTNVLMPLEYEVDDTDFDSAIEIVIRGLTE